MMGNIGHIANFDVKIRNIQNIFYMMGYGKLIFTFKLNEWAVAGKQMARQLLVCEFPQQYPSWWLPVHAFSYTCVLGWDGTRRLADLLAAPGAPLVWSIYLRHPALNT